ncbi:MAG TPA: hypothetical protein VE690_18475 [Rhodopila sp.]|nr:hypothetical protein [Rhodopila sp.]
MIRGIGFKTADAIASPRAIAWSFWRRAHQTAAPRSHLRKKRKTQL